MVDISEVRGRVLYSRSVRIPVPVKCRYVMKSNIIHKKQELTQSFFEKFANRILETFVNHSIP